MNISDSPPRLQTTTVIVGGCTPISMVTQSRANGDLSSTSILNNHSAINSTGAYSSGLLPFGDTRPLPTMRRVVTTDALEVADIDEYSSGRVKQLPESFNTHGRSAYASIEYASSIASTSSAMVPAAGAGGGAPLMNYDGATEPSPSRVRSIQRERPSTLGKKKNGESTPAAAGHDSQPVSMQLKYKNQVGLGGRHEEVEEFSSPTRTSRQKKEHQQQHDSHLQPPQHQHQQERSDNLVTSEDQVREWQQHHRDHHHHQHQQQHRRTEATSRPLHGSASGNPAKLQPSSGNQRKRHHSATSGGAADKQRRDDRKEQKLSNSDPSQKLMTACLTELWGASSSIVPIAANLSPQRHHIAGEEEKAAPVPSGETTSAVVVPPHESEANSGDTPPAETQPTTEGETGASEKPVPVHSSVAEVPPQPAHGSDNNESNSATKDPVKQEEEVHYASSSSSKPEIRSRSAGESEPRRLEPVSETQGSQTSTVATERKEVQAEPDTYGKHCQAEPSTNDIGSSPIRLPPGEHGSGQAEKGVVTDTPEEKKQEGATQTATQEEERAPPVKEEEQESKAAVTTGSSVPPNERKSAPPAAGPPHTAEASRSSEPTAEPSSNSAPEQPPQPIVAAQEQPVEQEARGEEKIVEPAATGKTTPPPAQEDEKKNTGASPAPVLSPPPAETARTEEEHQRQHSPSRKVYPSVHVVRAPPLCPPGFSAEEYLSLHPELQAQVALAPDRKTWAVNHWNQHGHKEGRAYSRSEERRADNGSEGDQTGGVGLTSPPPPERTSSVLSPPESIVCRSDFGTTPRYHDQPQYHQQHQQPKQQHSYSPTPSSNEYRSVYSQSSTAAAQSRSGGGGGGGGFTPGPNGQPNNYQYQPNPQPREALSYDRDLQNHHPDDYRRYPQQPQPQVRGGGGGGGRVSWWQAPPRPVDVQKVHYHPADTSPTRSSRGPTRSPSGGGGADYGTGSPSPVVRPTREIDFSSTTPSPTPHKTTPPPGPQIKILPGSSGVKKLELELDATEEPSQKGKDERPQDEVL